MASPVSSPGSGETLSLVGLEALLVTSDSVHLAEARFARTESFTLATRAFSWIPMSSIPYSSEPMRLILTQLDRMEKLSHAGHSEPFRLLIICAPSLKRQRERPEGKARGGIELVRPILLLVDSSIILHLSGLPNELQSLLYLQ